jgi:2-polyprenyl-6-methoxyphenol hydroxylase-like FAD-dependent oxidoreductase
MAERRISREDLHRVLRTATASTDVRFDTEVRGVDDAGTATFADGSTESYDLIVGADGIRSAAWRSAFGGPGPRLSHPVGMPRTQDEYGELR